MTTQDITAHSHFFLGRRLWHIYPKGWAAPLGSQYGETFADAIKAADGKYISMRGEDFSLADVTQDEEGFLYWKDQLLLPHKHGVTK